MLSLRDLRFVFFSLDLDVLRAQRIIGSLSYYPQINEVRKPDHMAMVSNLCWSAATEKLKHWI